jgi:hypothetical protein
MRKTLICLLASCAILIADDDNFRERFADPATRSAALNELIPGTRDAYFHTALDHQLAGRENAFLQTVAEWKAATERKNHRVSSVGLTVLENRQLLIDYRKNPQISLAELIRRLDLTFDDTRPDAAAAAESLPTRLDPALITRQAFEKAAAASRKKQPYANSVVPTPAPRTRPRRVLRRAKIRWFLENSTAPTCPASSRSSIARSAWNGRSRSASVALHKKLTSAQLDALLANPSGTPLQHRLQHRLSHQTPPGRRDRLRARPAGARRAPRPLPRPRAHPAARLRTRSRRTSSTTTSASSANSAISRRTISSPSSPCRASATRSSASRKTRPRIHPARCRLRRRHRLPACRRRPPAHRIISSISSARPIPRKTSPIIPEEKRLARLHARARLLAGENPDRWGRLLDPAEFKSLQEESRIDFAPGAPTLLDSAAEVSLALDLKNTPDLLIRIYELDLPAHLARHGSEPDFHRSRRPRPPPRAPHRLCRSPHRLSTGKPSPCPNSTAPARGSSISSAARFPPARSSARASSSPFPIATPAPKPSGFSMKTAARARGQSSRSAAKRFSADEAASSPSQRAQPARHPPAWSRPANSPPRSASAPAATTRARCRFHLAREQLLADQETKLLLRIRLTNHGHEAPARPHQNPASCSRRTC